MIHPKEKERLALRGFKAKKPVFAVGGNTAVIVSKAFSFCFRSGFLHPLQQHLQLCTQA